MNLRKAILAGVFVMGVMGYPVLHASEPARPERTARASSGGPGFEAQKAIDGHYNTRWSSDHSDPQWLEIDLGRVEHLVGLRLYWELAYGAAYAVRVSRDGEQWEVVYETTRGDGGLDDIDFDGVDARYVRLECRRRGTAWGYSLYQVVPKTAEHPWGEDNPPGFFLKKEWAFQPWPADGEEWKTISSHESWERQGFSGLGTGVYRNTYFVPADWTNTRPFIRVTDVRDAFELRVNDRVVARDHGSRRVLKYDVSDHLRYHDRNEIVLVVAGHESTGGIRGSVVLARDEEAYREGLRSLQQRDAHKFYRWLAHIEPEGWFPHWLTGRQGFWTTAGVDGDFKESLLCEDGTLEPYKSFSISPFLYVNGRLITREDADVVQTLHDGHIPVPSVTWSADDVSLRVTAFGAGPVGRTTTYVVYALHNPGAEAVRGTLFLAARPFEVNPPWQWGGFTRMHHVRRAEDRVHVNEFTLIPVTPPDGFGATGAPEGDVLSYLQRGALPPHSEFHDPRGTATAAFRYDFDLPPNGTITEILAVPLHADSEVARAGEGRTAREAVRDLFRETVRHWESRMPRLRFELPDRHLDDSVRAGLAHIFINRDGPAIQPGSRGYEAAWMRDGALISTALLQMGYTNEVREFLEWYEEYQYEDGRIPAIVIISRNEVNPVLELDSQGQWVSTVMEYYRYTGDRDFLEARWASVVKALEYLTNARKEEAEALKGLHDAHRYAGLLPKSVSHEGYYPEPGNHSYWDNFWAIKGWGDGAAMARVLGHADWEARFLREQESLREALLASIAVAQEWHGIDYIAGCAELGDFDPASTAIAIVACDELEHLPQPALDNTFDRYHAGLLRRREPGWRGSFSPYEIRIAQAFRMMGDIDRAMDVLEYMMEVQRPSGWRQWPEAVYFPEDQGGFIGDMPHSWVAAGLISALRAMFLLEHSADASLELAGGIPESWQKQGVGIRDAPTWWGTATLSVERRNGQVLMDARGDADPPGGFVVRLPAAEPIREVSLNGEPLPVPDRSEVRFDSLPARLVIQYGVGDVVSPASSGP